MSTNGIVNQAPEAIKQEAPGVYPLSSLAVKKACGCPLFQPCNKCGKYLDKKEFEAGVKAQTEPVASNAGLEAVREVLELNSRLMKSVMGTNDRLKAELATMTEQKDMFAKENAVLKSSLAEKKDDDEQVRETERFLNDCQNELARVHKENAVLKRNLIDNVNIDADETSSREEYTLRLQEELAKVRRELKMTQSNDTRELTLTLVRKENESLRRNNKELHESQASAVKHQEDLMRQIRQAMIQNESHRANLESSLDTIHSLKQQINALSKQGRGF